MHDRMRPSARRLTRRSRTWTTSFVAVLTHVTADGQATDDDIRPAEQTLFHERDRESVRTVYRR